VNNDLTWTEETTGLCPTCLRTVPAVLADVDGGVTITQTCPRHGQSSALIASDAAHYHRLRQYVPDRSGREACCGPGVTCGPDVGPPTCVLLLEITQACNLRCPTCFADAQGHDFMSIDEARRRLDKFFADQSALDVLMISGGEPTIHPQFVEILDLALSYPVGRVLINTNGLRYVQNQAIAEAIAARRKQVELFLSFSSFRPEVHERLYGKDLRREKLAALDRARADGVFTTLVPVVERGVNDDEIGDLYRFALTYDNVNGLNFQPVMSAGRYDHDYSPAERLTLTDVLRCLEEQTFGDLVMSDFVGLPCSHPDCCALTYGLLDARRERIIPLPRHLDVARYMDLFSDRISFAGLIGAAARRVWSDMVSLRGGRTLRDLAVLYSRAGVRDLAPLLNRPDDLGKRILRIVVKPFMDAHTYDAKRVDQCCTKILDASGNAMSFCEYNVFHRGKLPRDARVPLVMVKPTGVGAR